MSSANKLDFVQGVSLLPWEWNNLGAVFGSSKENNQCVAARCNFVVRKGFDEVEQTQYGNVLEGLGDVGFNLRAKQYAFHISASNLSYKQGERLSQLEQVATGFHPLSPRYINNDIQMDIPHMHTSAAASLELHCTGHNKAVMQAYM